MAEAQLPVSDLIAQFKAFNLDVNSKDDAMEMKSNACTKMVNASLKAKYGADISKRTDSVFSGMLAKSGQKKKTMTVNEANVTAFVRGTALAAYYLKTGKAPPKGGEEPPQEYVEGVTKAFLECKAVKVATKQSTKGGVDRLTDTAGYTGAHKERFDKDGKGKGKEGREDLHENDGYVGNYKGKGTKK